MTAAPVRRQATVSDEQRRVVVTPDNVIQAHPDHHCSQHPTITHARWLECQFEARDILEDVLLGIEDPEMEAVRRQHDAKIERIRRMYES